MPPFYFVALRLIAAGVQLIRYVFWTVLVLSFRVRRIMSTAIGDHLRSSLRVAELSPNFGDGPRVQAAAVWDCEDAGLAATSIPSVNLTP
jgi:hypothetical protein